MSASVDPAKPSCYPVVHPNSLIARNLHLPELLELIGMEISQRTTCYFAAVITCTANRGLSKLKPGAQLHLDNDASTQFAEFVERVINTANVSMPTLLVALVYLDRANLSIASKNYALERVFLGAVIVASKYLNDMTLKNVHWSMCTGLFGLRDIGRIEREYLTILEYRLRVSENDILTHYRGIALATFTMQSLYQLPAALSFRHSPQPSSRAQEKVSRLRLRAHSDKSDHTPYPYSSSSHGELRQHRGARTLPRSHAFNMHDRLAEGVQDRYPLWHVSLTT